MSDDRKILPRQSALAPRLKPLEGEVVRTEELPRALNVTPIAVPLASPAPQPAPPTVVYVQAPAQAAAPAINLNLSQNVDQTTSVAVSGRWGPGTLSLALAILGILTLGFLSPVGLVVSIASLVRGFTFRACFAAVLSAFGSAWLAIVVAAIFRAAQGF